MEPTKHSEFSQLARYSVMDKSGWILMRHAEDEDYIDGRFNNPLTDTGLQQSEYYSKKLAGELRGGNLVNLYVSTKLRAQQTGNIVLRALEESGFIVTRFDDNRLRDFDQGSIPSATQMALSESARKLSIARQAFYLQYKIRGNHQYRFGMPMEEPDFAELKDFIYPYGETQSEFLDRLYDFMLDRISNLLENGSPQETENIIVTHKATAWRLRQIGLSCRLTVDEDDVNEPDTAHGEYYRVDFGDTAGCIKALKGKINLNKGAIS
ncbi:MAG: histidine phosphatase family protein [Candidatus Saccharimonadales bacterium]